jgi:hypothetical protein
MPEYHRTITYKSGKTQSGIRYFKSDQIDTVKHLVEIKIREGIGGLFSIQDIEVIKLDPPKELFNPFK